ncbi:MAG: anaerobic ribonucleoside-triphosphate reductase activating protein [Oscillospiraceae bacterium]|nr:anaerobic ribonucleoside-triphosphate reductase activating protein [Oscillospiraceae bacterium]
MRYAQIRSLDISNGTGVGVALFTQGCHFHCSGCFNANTWDFKGGIEWTKETHESFMKLVDRPYIQRVTILGGEPLEECNYDALIDLLREIKSKHSDKIIWLYTGFTWEDALKSEKRKEILQYADVVVEGQYKEALKDPNLHFRGSSNQRIINSQESLKKGKVVAYV